MRDTFRKLLADQRGPTLLEYAGLGVLILIAIWAATKALGKTTGETFQEIDSKMKDR